jgi:eukaryotic-like serine/threonine-protein kinase
VSLLSPTESTNQIESLGDYTLHRLLAQGGMGEVYLASHGDMSEMQKLCVVKTLRKDFSQNKEYLNRFLDEARLAVLLSHRNIGQVFHVERVDDVYFISMEFIKGRDLKTILEFLFKQKQAIPEAIAITIVSEILSALEYAHRLEHPSTGKLLHVVHRDVSPHNVMLSLEGEIKLIDFGLAASTQKQEKTDVKKVMGKMAYMSPEQARGDAIQGKSDLFSTAIICYELVAGETFYGNLSQSEIWEVVGLGGFRPTNWRKLPKTLSKILDRALSAPTDGRYSDAEAFRFALESYSIKRGLHASHTDLRNFFNLIYPNEKKRIRNLLTEIGSGSNTESAKEETEPRAGQPQPISPSKAITHANPIPRPKPSLTPKPGIRSSEVTRTNKYVTKERSEKDHRLERIASERTAPKTSIPLAKTQETKKPLAKNGDAEEIPVESSTASNEARWAIGIFFSIIVLMIFLMIFVSQVLD